MSVELELRSLEVSYGSRVAVANVSLKVPAGSFFCLLGPSGCGKSTTLAAIAGLLAPSGGQVLVAGQDITRLTPQNRKMGVVFQSYALFQHMTAAENIGYGLKMQKKSKPEIAARVGELLQLVRLEGKGDRYPKQLSGGEQQRVAIARALAIQPRLLLLDEPLSNLDARLREEMRVELKRIQRQTGITTILVTHDQEEAFSVSDQVGVMSEGRLEQVGAPGEIYRTPKTPFVAGFIGRGNRLAVLRHQDGAEAVLRVGPYRLQSQNAQASDIAQGVLFLRPEELTLSAAPNGANAIPGKVIDANYTGSTITYRVRTEVGDLEVCRFANQGGELQPGSDTVVHWSPEAGIILPAAAHG